MTAAPTPVATGVATDTKDKIIEPQDLTTARTGLPL